LNLERSIDNLAKRLDRHDPVFTFSNKTSLSHWKGKPIIPLDEWIEIRDTPYALDYFPDDFDQDLTYISEDEFEQVRQREEVKRWDSDYLELMEYTKNPNYGKLKCFHCLLSPDGDDPIFIGINRLVAKGLTNSQEQKDLIQYPCQVVNRFQCPYERTNINGDDDDIRATNSAFDVEDLFRLHKLAFAVEIALAKAMKDDAQIRINNKEELFHALTDQEMFRKILEQGTEAHEVDEYIKSYLRENRAYILDSFLRIKDLVDIEELRFY
jgi:hypothetical protein